MGQGRAVALLVAVTLIGCAQPDSTPEPAVLPLPPVTRSEPSAEVDRITQTKNALALFDAKRYDEAVPALTEAARAYPEIAPFLRLRVVEAEVARGNFKEAAAIAAEIVALSDTSAATVARLRLPAIYAQLDDAA